MNAADTTECDDDALVARARAGDRPAFGELVRRHQRSAVRVAAVISGSTEEAYDIVQDAFVNMHRHLGTYDGRGPVRSWMLRVVANHAKNQVRGRVRRLRRDERHAGLALTVADSAEEVAERRLEHEALVVALGRLRADDRAVLGCRFVVGLGEAETAQVLGIALGTVKSRTSRALGRLHDQLERGGISSVSDGAPGRLG
ncbi:MAG: RNA polymerase sigma factor [Acidimicrobiaceae bacterium]|nr:RNA polymerase sigma factor [Acidimicrobiaceae bacterium]